MKVVMGIYNKKSQEDYATGCYLFVVPHHSPFRQYCLEASWGKAVGRIVVSKVVHHMH